VFLQNAFKKMPAMKLLPNKSELNTAANQPVAIVRRQCLLIVEEKDENWWYVVAGGFEGWTYLQPEVSYLAAIARVAFVYIFLLIELRLRLRLWLYEKLLKDMRHGKEITFSFLMARSCLEEMQGK